MSLMHRYTMRRRCGSRAWKSFVAAKKTSLASFCGGAGEGARCEGTQHADTAAQQSAAAGALALVQRLKLLVQLLLQLPSCLVFAQC